MPVVEQQLPTGTYQADKVHSTIGFSIKHMVVATFRGGFSDYDASLAVDGGEPRLVGVVRTESVEVKDESLKGHLGAPDFFDTERHPEIRFESTGFRTSDDGEVVVDGELTIKGVTKPVEARGTVTPAHTNIAGVEVVGLDLETVIDRTAFGLNWNAPLPKGGVALANDVKLHVELELAHQG